MQRPQDFQRLLRIGERRIHQRGFERAVKSGRMTDEEAAEALARIDSTTDLEAAGERADHVIEAVVEVIEVKEDVFRRLDAVCAEPVIFASNDVYYALDAEGRGFTSAAMVEGVWRPSAHDGRSLLTQAILWRALETHPTSFNFHDGLQGAAIAKERGLPLIAEATGETERWWADEKRLIVEIDRGNGYEGPMTYATK